MSRQSGKPSASRRGFLATSARLAAAGASLSTVAATNAVAQSAESRALGTQGVLPNEPFWGPHQGGILTPAQTQTYFAAFDLVTTKREDVVRLLQAWTVAAARMSEGQTAQPLGDGFRPVAADNGGQAPTKDGDAYEKPDWRAQAADSGEALGLSPARLTVTFGFGAGLFIKDGKDRYGLASSRPPAFVDLPRFVGDQLVEAHTGGDLSVQACADDPQVAFHAVRQLARIAEDVAQVRWTQTGFIPRGKGTPRNLMGFRDGTNNPSITDPKAMERFVWVGAEGPNWMRGGSYVVARRIRIALEHWDRMKVAFQEQTVGREKVSGAPLGGKREFEPLDLNATDKDGNPVIAENAHVRLAASANNDGAQILRRPYSYNDGVNFTAERWPPWRQGMEYDAGLFFVAYQRDPRTGFILIYDKMARLDMMNQFVTHVGGGLFACPRGPAKGEFIGEQLLQAA